MALKCANKEKSIFGIDVLHLGTPARLAAMCRMWGRPEYGEKGDTSSWTVPPGGREFRFVDNPGANELFPKFYKGLVDAKAYPLAEDQIQGGLFVAGKSALTQGEHGHPYRLLQGIGDNWDFHPEDCMHFPPGPDGRWGTAQETQVRCVSALTEHPEAALQCLDYQTSFEAGLISIPLTGTFSGRRSVYEHFSNEFPYYRDWVEFMDSGIVEGYPMPWCLRDVEVLDVFRAEFAPLFQAEVTWEEQAPVIEKAIQAVFDLDRP